MTLCSDKKSFDVGRDHSSGLDFFSSQELCIVKQLYRLINHFSISNRDCLIERNVYGKVIRSGIEAVL